jgi:hypothetical protein
MRAFLGQNRLVSLVLFASVFAACGGEPEPQTPATVPSASVSVAPSASTPPPPPPEPTTAELKLQAKAAFEAGDLVKARETLTIVTTKDGKDVEAWQMLAEVYVRAGDAKGATDAYVSATTADGGKNEALALTAAKGLHDAHRWDELIVVVNTSLKVNDKSQPLWIHLAIAQSAKGDHAGAAETWTKLTVAFPDEPHIAARAAVELSVAGKTDDAKKSAKAALDKWTEARKPKFGKPLNLGRGAHELALIARALRRSGDAAGAIVALGKYTVAKDETAPELDVERSLAKRTKHDAAGAKSDAEKALKAGGNDYAPGILALAGASLEAKKYDDAKKQLDGYDALAASRAPWVWELAADRDAIAYGIAQAASAAASKPAAPAGKPTPKKK